MKKFFLPGAGGSASFRQPVAQQLRSCDDHHFFSWPRLGNEPHRDNVTSIDDLVDMVIAELTEPTALIAQSMGGYVALMVALERPKLVSHLVLTAASAGLAMDKLGAINWRANYRRNFPNAADYITEPTRDLTARLRDIQVPCLLLWGRADPISPVTVGERLQTLLPNARLVIFDDGDHDLAVKFAKEVAHLIDNHLLAHPLPKNTSGSS